MKINSGSLAVGELIGAASFIVAVVAGSMAIMRPFKVARRPFLRDVVFFIVAILFCIAVLADGEIHTWECIVMVLYYVSYVLFVCIWHWWSTRRKRIRLTETHARDHYVPLGEEEAGSIQDDDEDGGVSSSGSGLLSIAPDIRLLESQEYEEAGQDNEEEELAAYAELSNNMRVTRSRSGTVHLPPTTPHSIRPSLVGALEVRSEGKKKKKMCWLTCFANLLYSSAPSSIPLKNHKISEAGQYTCAGTPTTQFCIHPHSHFQHQAL